jgi:serine protease inhibitor
MSGRFELPLGYSRDLECSILEMPFVQKRISLFLLLPDDPVDGIRQLERNLTSRNLKSLFSTLKVSAR